MSVVGRLWRRAPAWRLLLILGIGSSGLVAMFPPQLPSLSGLRARLDTAPGNPAADPAPRYTPEPDKPPLDYSTISFPPIAATRSGVIPFAGRQVPLPAGKWSELALLRGGGLQAEQAVVLARMQSDRLTGMIVVAGSPAVQAAVPSPVLPAGCIDIAGLGLHDLSPPDTRNGMLQECWTMRRLATSVLIDANSRNLLESKSFARLGKLDIEVPAHLLSSYYFRRDEHGNLSVTILLPDPAENDTAMMRRAEGWMQRWVPLLHRGYEGALRPADISASLARDPGAASKPS